jgi:Domain of unknown function (DUF4174)
MAKSIKFFVNYSLQITSKNHSNTMNSFITFLFLFLMSLSNNMLAQSKSTMEKYRWENRIVLVFSPSEKNEAYRQQLSSLVEGEKGVEERDIVVFKIFEDRGVAPKV